MRQVYAHRATLVPSPGADPAAAVTTALHPHPHHTTTDPAGGELHLRVLFATDPARVEAIRTRIDAALAEGDWRLLDSGCTRLDPAERPHARRLLKDA